MKIKFFNLIVFLPFLFSSINSFAQEEEKLNISWVDDYAEQSVFMNSLGKAYINSKNYYRTKISFPTDVKLERIIDDSVVFSKEMDVNYNGKKKSLVVFNGSNYGKIHYKELLVINQKLYCIVRFYKKKFIHYSIQEYSDSFDPIGTMVELVKIPVKSKKKYGSMSLILSQNSKYFMIFWNDKVHKKQMYNYSVFDENLQKQYSKDYFSLPYASNTSKIEDKMILLTDNGHLIYVEKEYQLKNKGNDEENLKSLHVHHVFEKSDKDFKVSIENKKINHITAVYDITNTLSMYAIYENTNTAKNRYGLLQLNLNLNAEKSENVNFISLEDSYLQQGFSEKEISLVDKKGIRAAGAVSFNFLYVLGIKNVRNLIDGSTIIELELNSNAGGSSIFSVGEFNNMSAMYSMGTGGPMGGGALGMGDMPSGTSEYFHSQDIYVMKISPNSEIDWKTKIRKRQLFFLSPKFLSYYSYQHKDQLHIMYNDNIANKEVKCQDFPEEYKPKDQIITHVIVDLKNGSTNKYVCDEQKMKEMFILPGFKSQEENGLFHFKMTNNFNNIKAINNQKSATIVIE